MKPRLGTIAAVVIVVTLPALLTAQEQPRRFYSGPIGVTQADALRVLIAPAPLRFQGLAGLCHALVTVEFLDGIDMSVLSTEGPTLISIGASLQADFTPLVGPPPERREIIVRTSIDRSPSRPTEEGSLDEICPISSSIQLHDIVSGRTLVVTPTNLRSDIFILEL